MATPCEEEAMEVEQNPGESPKTSDLNIIINGENNEYITTNIFRAIFYKRSVKFRFFSLFKKSHYLAIVIIVVVIIVVI